MTQIDEYLWAILSLVGALVCFLIQIRKWSHPTLSKVLRIVAALVVTSLIGYFIAATYKKKGDKPWLSLWTEDKPSPTPTSEPQFFSARLNSIQPFKYPGPLLCIYTSQLGKTIAPVSIITNVEVVSLRPGRTRIYTYKADALIEYSKGGQTVKEPYPLLNVPISGCEVYVVPDDWKKAKRVDFSSNDFDLHARRTQLEHGESILGWMFFEIDPKVRALNYKVLRIDLTVENNLKEKQTIPLTPSEEQGRESTLSSGALDIMEGYYDLTKEEYKPASQWELHEMLKRQRVR